MAHKEVLSEATAEEQENRTVGDTENERGGKRERGKGRGRGGKGEGGGERGEGRGGRRKRREMERELDTTISDYTCSNSL